MKKILYIDDEPINLNIFELAFRNDFQIFKSVSAKEGINIFRQEDIDVVITDLKMPEMDGVELIKEIKKISPSTSCILLTAYYEPHLANNSDIQSIVFEYVVKPFKKKELKEIIRKASV